MPLYGTQVMSRPGQAAIGYGPAGQTYNDQNPVAMTTSGVRPLSVASTRVVPHNPPSGAAPVSAATQWQMANPSAGSRLGREAAAREQALYGVDRYGGTAPNYYNNQGSGAGGPLGQSPIGIGQGGGGVLAGAQARLHYGQAPGQSVSPAAMQEIDRNFQNVYGAQQNSADLDLLRRTAFEGANLNLDRLKAQSSANVDWQNLMARLLESQMQRENFGMSALYGLG